MDFTCLLAALLFFTGNLILLVYYVNESNREHFQIELYKDLNPQQIKDEWAWRIEHRAPYLAAGLINGLAWFFISFPLIQLAWILSHRGTRSLWMHIAIGVLALAGSVTEWISRFLYMGSSMATQMLVNKFQLDNWIGQTNDGIGWRVLEVTHVVVSGLIWFIDAFEWLAIFFIMTLVHVSVRRWRSWDAGSFGACWNAVGLFIALLSLLDFVAEVLRLDGFQTFADIAFWYASVNRLLLIPYWLIVLGRSLPYAALRLSHSGNPDNAPTNGENHDLSFAVEGGEEAK